ncbi:ammonium transmembrane transporter [Aureococcus anophagefferens]|uniref:Ammonium transmembrane transporter n=1 Tax=Aureococcus anophagefferens TaxID=44056 RepID=A0ABR1FVM6_AURAN
MADDDAVAELAEAVDVGWILVCTALVFWEQAGFAMLEAGSVRARNLGNILFKNLLDVSLGAVVFAAVGYGLAFGDSASGVVGSTGFFLRSLESPYDYAIWAWHWSFAATAATTVSGASAASPRTRRRSVARGARRRGAREPDAGKGKADDLRGFAGHNATLTALGVYCLWFGWFGFNAGCSGGLSGGGAKVAALAAVNTALAPPCGALVALGVERWRAGYWSLPATVSGLLAGLVGITGPAASSRRAPRSPSAP